MIWWPSVASAEPTTFMPPVATAIAGQFDSVYGFLLTASFIAFVGVVGAMIYFVLKFKRRSADDKTAYITHNHLLEFLWSFIPFVLFMFVFGWGWIVYSRMRTMPEDGLEVHVIAKKWDWRFVYKNGKEVTSGLDANNKRIPPTMVVPLGRPVKLIMSSERQSPGVPLSEAPTDRAVIHSFFVPAFRIKQDVVPGRYTTLWFQADQPGEYWVFCAEYCGTSHFDMTAKIKVVSTEEFEEWLASEGGGELPLADLGRQVYAQKACIGCHTLDGRPSVGPTWKGLWGKKVMTDKGEFTVDEEYIRESILEPNAKKVKGFENAVMPPYAGTITEDEIRAVIEFIKTLK